MKKVFCVVLVIALLLSTLVFSASANVGYEAEDVVFFEDDFNSYDGGAETATKLSTFKSNGWDATTATASCLNGTGISIPADADRFYIATLEGADWKDYSVSVDITAAYDKDSIVNNLYAGVSARSDDRTNGGYELSVFAKKETVDENNNTVPFNTGVRILKRKNDDAVTENTELASKKIEIESGKTYRLTLKVEGNVLTGYLDGKAVITATDSSYTAGCAGIRSLAGNTGVETAFDNFKVEYCFPPIFEEDFSETGTPAEICTAMTENGWEINEEQCAYVDTENHELSLPAKNIYLTTKNAPGAYVWNDYTVSADVFIGETETVTASKGIYAGIVGRLVSITKTGYEYSLFVKANKSGTITKGLRLFRRDNADKTVETLELKTLTGIGIELGETYNLAMTFVGNTIYCYLNGELMITANDDAYSYGYAGIRSLVTYTDFDSAIVFDNYKVTLPGNAYLIPEKKAYFADSFVGYNVDGNADTIKSNLKANKWEVKTTSIPNYCTDNKYIVNNKNANIYNTTYSGSDYSVEVDVQLSNVSSTYADTTYFGVAGRMNSGLSRPDAYSGYEFAIGNDKGACKARLYRQEDAKGSTVITKVQLKAVKYSLQADKIYHLEMRFSGTTITCFINGQQVIEVIDENYSSGVAGIRTTTNASADCYGIYDNFKVTDYSYVKENIGCITGGKDVSGEDLAELKKTLLGQREGNALCDVNKDGAVDLCDIIRLKKILVSYR